MSLNPRSSREWLSYRLSLVVVVPLLVILTGGLIAGNSYLQTRHSIELLANKVFGEAADQATEQARAHVFQAAPAADLLATILVDPGETDNTKDLSENLLAVLRANAGFAWVSYSDEKGTFTGVRRKTDGTIMLNVSTVQNGKTISDDWIVGPNNSLKPFRHRDSTAYDPRERPFYKLAKAAKKRIWTNPYVFYDEGVPGITCAAPVLAADGSVRGVVTVDFDLEILSQFVAGLHTSPHTRVFVYTASGEILAHPTVKVVRKTDAKAEGEIVTKDTIDDDVVRAYFAADGKDRFVYQGERWFSAKRTFDKDDDLAWSVGAVAPESDFMQGVEATARRSLAVSLFVSLLAVIFAAFLAGRIARPLAHLASQMDKVGKLDLAGGDPPPTMFREIGAMNRALTAMKGGLKSFAFYVPRDLVRTLLASGEEAVLGGKTREMTVFFSDLAGFTTISERLSPTELVEMLGGYFDEMTQQITNHGGTVDKFIGDAIMSFWNAPTDDPHHARRACEAALACMNKLDAMKAADPKLKDVNARIGIATGEVVVGNIGSHERMNYTVMGDTTNLASRLEGLNKVYNTRILVGEVTYREAKTHVVFRAVDVVAVKGKSKGVRVYEPIAHVDEKNELALKLSEISMRALDTYLAKNFAEAATLYEEMLTLRPDDSAVLVMKARAIEFQKNPPGEDWTGVQIAKEK